MQLLVDTVDLALLAIDQALPTLDVSTKSTYITLETLEPFDDLP